MEEKVLYHQALRETIATKKLPSGIKCYIMPKKDYVEKMALLAVNYGSEDVSFLVGGGQVDTPPGVAHFLEHKLFEDLEGDLFQAFTKAGGDVNAFTNYNTTAYHFTCIDNFEENLKLLLRLVMKPYFTDENVEKEKGIIGQEIQMYRDYPSWRMFFNMQSRLYQRLYINRDITGSAEDIQRIDKDILYTCYNAFYRPENMALICIGDIVPEQVYEICEGLVDGPADKNMGRHLNLAEPKEVGEPFVSEDMPVSRTLFQLGFKDNDLTEDRLAAMVGTKVLLDYVVGESSDLYECLYQKGLIDGSFSAEYVCGPSYGTSIFGGYCEDPKEFNDALLLEIEKITAAGMDMGRLDQMIKKHRGSFIRSFNTIETTANLQADLFNKNLELFDLMDCFDRLEPDMLTQRMKKHFNSAASVLSVIRPS